MLEYNLYDNFNPNYMSYDTIETSNGTKFPKGFPAPRARGVLVDYEIWETGFEFTSSAVFTMDVNIGDVVEVLTTKDQPLMVTASTMINPKLSIWYVVTDVDDDNKATLQNYFWHNIEGSSYPAQNVYGYAATVWNILTQRSPHQAGQDMLWNSMANWDTTNLEIKFNLKADTVEKKELAKILFTRLRQQPIIFAYDSFNIGERGLVAGLLSNQWNRQPKNIRIDFAQNPTKETIVTTERSKQNFVAVYIKDPLTEKYPSNPKVYTLNTTGGIVDLDDYDRTGKDLPAIRKVKTLFYDEQPTIPQIKFEIMPDTVVSKIYFNQNELYELHTNDLVELWYDGTRYRGHIADRCFTQGTDRLCFVEGNE